MPKADDTTSKSAETEGQDKPEVMPPVTVVQTSPKPKRTPVRRSAPNMSPVRREVVAVPPAAPVTPPMSRASILSQPAGVPAKLQQFQAESAETSDGQTWLNQLPGTSVYSAGGVSGLPVIDGFAADRLHVEVAGMDLMAACANQMNPPLSYIAPPQVGSITVYSNIVPVSVGGDSIGGAILVEPRAPAFAPTGQGIVTSANIGAYYRSNGDAFGGNVSAAAAAQNFSVGYDGTYAKSANYIAGGNFKPAGPAFMGVPGINQAIPFLDADEVGSTAYEAMNHNVSVAARNGDHLLKLDLGIQHIPYQLYPNQRMDMTDNESINGIVRYTGDFDWGVLKASVYDQYVRHEMNFGADKQYYYGGAMSDGGGMSGGGMSGMSGMSSGGPVVGHGRHWRHVWNDELRSRTGHADEHSGKECRRNPRSGLRSFESRRSARRRRIPELQL